MPREIPDWVNETPDDRHCELVMWQGADDALQSIDITRDEYVDLKRHLAAMRGYSLGDLREEIRALSKEMRDDPARTLSCDPEQVSSWLAVAREMYRRCPEIVVGSSVPMEALKELVDEAAWHEELAESGTTE